MVVLQAAARLALEREPVREAPGPAGCLAGEVVRCWLEVVRDSEGDPKGALASLRLAI